MRLVTAIAIAGVVVLTACTSGPTPTAAAPSATEPVSTPTPPVVSRSPEAAVMPCSDPIEALDALPEAYKPILDVVALPRQETHQRGRTDPETGFVFSKMGLVVRVGAAFRIEVAPTSRDNARISWDNTGSIDPVLTLEVENCSGPRTWIVYPGGIWTRDPSCVALLITAGPATEEIDLPIGAPCP